MRRASSCGVGAAGAGCSAGCSAGCASAGGGSAGGGSWAPARAATRPAATPISRPRRRIIGDMLSSDVSIESFSAGDLTIAAEDQEAGPIRLLWQGSSTDRYPGRLLSPYFSTVLVQAATRKAPVEMRFEKLDHFNSSTITCIIQVIQE